MISTLSRLPPKVEHGDNVRIITLRPNKIRDVGDMIAGELEGRTERMGAGHLLLDFTNVVQLASAELGTLVMLRKRLTAAGGRLTLFNLSAQIYEVFTVTGLHTLLDICREEGESPGSSGRQPGLKDKAGEAEGT